MPNPTTATLAYQVTPTLAAATAVKAKMQSIQLYASATNDPVLKVLFDCTVMSDATDLSVTRTITLSLGPGFFALFPTAASWASVFNGFFARTLALLMPAEVSSLPVVFA